MTYRAFIKALRGTERRWELINGQIRFFDFDPRRAITLPFCPITRVHKGVTGLHYYLKEWDLAANDLRLRETTARKIMEAADRPSNRNRIRKDLLRATAARELYK